MQEEISRFLGQKNLSDNSRKAYTYDLTQLLETVGETISASKLQVYEAFLASLKPTARQRKLSAVNQFLFYLYQKGLVADFYRLAGHERPQVVAKHPDLLDLSVLFEETADRAGQLIALLISQLGLTPSEIAQLKVADINRDFQVITVKKGDLVRVLPLPERLLPYLIWDEGAIFLFEKNGRALSRQWFFTTLSRYLTSLGLTALTAQKLREQYILQELRQGTSLRQLAKQLGLKTTVTLAAYENHGY